MEWESIKSVLKEIDKSSTLAGIVGGLVVMTIPYILNWTMKLLKWIWSVLCMWYRYIKRIPKVIDNINTIRDYYKRVKKHEVIKSDVEIKCLELEMRLNLLSRLHILKYIKKRNPSVLDMKFTDAEKIAWDRANGGTRTLEEIKAADIRMSELKEKLSNKIKTNIDIETIINVKPFK